MKFALNFPNGRQVVGQGVGDASGSWVGTASVLDVPGAINQTAATYDTVNLATKRPELGDVVHFTFFAQERAADGRAYWMFVRLIIRGNTVHYTR
jgi:hypothetical protein